ncbi:hypothetical protein OSB04_008227 [Centaurea solstitialis]|uniref:Uncharacterized protein n=1 Tax=Centaurea solstitialis TaxID=347529 RepID=A0AA38U4M9_9ASTR|nr:hypothetical protein OSB04_008227 [Centaurea solstitialis]
MMVQELECRMELSKVKEVVQHLFVETIDPVEMLELLDNIGKLGLSSYFEREIYEVLDDCFESLKSGSNYLNLEDDLYAIALCFRMLRMNGYNVSEDMLMGFMDKAKKIMNMNVKPMVSLYEASCLAMEDENILAEARVFATTFLDDFRSSSKDKLAEEIELVLEIPMNLRVEWFNVRNHICNYEKTDSVTFYLLKLAKLNFNLVQAAQQRDLKDILRWWKTLPTTEHLSFTRNRVVESFLWATGVAFETQYGNLRKWLTKVTKLVIIIDDIYDVFGTLEELEIFTSAVERWDFEKTEILPDSMKFCMKMLYDTVDEIAQELLKGKGWTVQQHIQNAWIVFCKGLLAEARWYHKRYTPNLYEYLENGWVTSCGPLLSLHVVYSISHGPQEEANDFLKKNHQLVYDTSMIIRLCNDQGTSKAELERGDAPSSIVCYMKEADVSEKVARKQITDIITHTWKRINNVCMSRSPAIKCITNMARVAHFIYRKGDGFGIQHHETREQVLALLVDPLPLH